MVERYAVTVEMQDNRAGRRVTVIFYADTEGRADLLADMLRTMKEQNPQILSWTDNDWRHLQLREVLPPVLIKQ